MYEESPGISRKGEQDHFIRRAQRPRRQRSGGPGAPLGEVHGAPKGERAEKTVGETRQDALRGAWAVGPTPLVHWHNRGVLEPALMTKQKDSEKGLDAEELGLEVLITPAAPFLDRHN